MSSTQNEDRDIPQERQDVHAALRIGSIALGIVIVVIALTAVARYMLDFQNAPTPEDVQVSYLLAIGIILLLIFNVPWTKIKFGQMEIERAITNQALDYTEEIEQLKSTIMELKGAVANPAKLSFAVQKKLDEFSDSESKLQEDEVLLLNFLSQWENWGFTATRIQRWGAQQAGYERLGELSTTQIRSLAARLMKKNLVRTRLSKSDSLLYQAAS